MKKLLKLRYVVLTLFVLLIIVVLQQIRNLRIALAKNNKSVGFKLNFPSADAKSNTSANFIINQLSLEHRSSCETIHISIVCAGSQSTRQVVTLIKSILFYRTNPLHIHFAVNDQSRITLSHLFQTWDISSFTVSFYLVDDYLENVSWIPTSHYSGVYGLLKLTLLNILPKHIVKVIALDTDIVFVTDIAELWKYFDQFENEEAIGLVENQSDWYLGTLFPNFTPWPAIGRGYNTGVMLLNNNKLRQWHWNNLWQETAKDVLQSIPRTALADQDIINSVIKKHPSLAYKLPCYWNLQLSINVRMDLCYSHHYNNIKVIHWNTKKKHMLQHRNLKVIKNLYETFVDMNGDLVQLNSRSCKSNNEYEDYVDLGVENEDATEPCAEFVISSSSLHRTHLYFLSFDYKVENKPDISVVVHLSVDRFPMLEKLCSYWEGPVSASIFASDAEAERFAYFVQKSTILSGRNNIAYHIVYKNRNEKVYPINFMRNVALHYAITDYVFLFDVDFVPMPGLYRYILTHISSSSKTRMTAFVIPAFESFLYKFDMPLTKSELLTHLSSGAITTFRSYMWPEGHAATNFTAWQHAQRAYNIQWEPNFEPYVVVFRENCPAYDKRFSGFGWNKISHIMELHAAGFAFTVLPFGFIVHLPHSPSIDLIKFRSLTSYRKCLESAKYNFIKYLGTKYGENAKYITTD